MENHGKPMILSQHYTKTLDALHASTDQLFLFQSAINSKTDVPYLPDLPMFKAHIGTGFHIAFHMLLACRLMGPLVGVDESQI
jgi:hypothetical protein